jgi:SAM-dependent methyltransferase
MNSCCVFGRETGRSCLGEGPTVGLVSLHRQHAAWLLGLEGIALLRHGAGDDVGGGFVESRLAEVRRIVDAIDDETPLVDIGDISVREGYAIWAASYDGEDNPLFGPDQAAVRPLLDALAVGRIADVASGTGRHAAYLAERGHDVVAFDLSAEMLGHGSGRRVQADLRCLPLPDDSVDAAICTLALTHLPNLGPAFAEMARVVRQGGTIVTSDIHVLSLYLGGVAHADGRRMPATRYFASDYVRGAVAAGLEIVTCLEPRWGVVKGGGGPLAQQWCAAASAAAYRDTPAAIVWSFRVR